MLWLFLPRPFSVDRCESLVLPPQSRSVAGAAAPANPAGAANFGKGKNSSPVAATVPSPSTGLAAAAPDEIA